MSRSLQGSLLSDDVLETVVAAMEDGARNLAKDIAKERRTGVLLKPDQLDHRRLVNDGDNFLVRLLT